MTTDFTDFTDGMFHPRNLCNLRSKFSVVVEVPGTMNYLRAISKKLEKSVTPTDADEHGCGVNANFDLTSLAGRMTLPTMSATEIINELPKLTEAELRLVRQRLLELAAQDQDIELCNQAALDGAMMLDRMEDDDGRRQSR